MLNITTYGNVSGQATVGPYPPPDSPKWKDPSITFGKIPIEDEQTNTLTTLKSTYDVLTYTAYDAPRLSFCKNVVNPECPIAPAFNGTVDHPSTLPAFTVGHQFFSSFAFATIISTVIVESGAKSAPLIACVSAPITPDLGETISGVISYLPVVILLFVAISTVLAAMASPWGTTDPFKWTSNYGRDEDLLRLVTPGFGDCLQYVQFVILSGSLSLAYPGFYQPVVSQVSWATLMFKESFVSHGKGVQAVVDGIYVTKGSFGLSRMRQLVGMSQDFDVWAGMASWTVVIIIFVVALCQFGFFLRWALRNLAKKAAEDLRSKNWPFTGGNVVRVIFNFFLLPIVSLSMFQMVVAFRSPGVTIGFAVVLLVAILAFMAWTFRLIFTTKPRSHLFDDLPTLLLYGPLYNTYTDGAAPFALIPTLLTLIRGVAIGGVQPSGIAQIVVLAICEVILILTLHAFRPFHSATSMNAYHTVFASVRLVTILLMIAFTSSLGLTEGPKGWIGYVILLLHTLVLIFGFFLNAVQTIIEVCARLAGAGGDKISGAPTRGGLTKAFGVRQLSRRQKRSEYRSSQRSDEAMLADADDAKSAQFGGRSRSLSASSAILLSQHRSSDPRVSSHLDRSLSGGTGLTDWGLEQTPRTFLPSGSKARQSRVPQLGIKMGDAADPYYRPPRQRRQTGEFMTPGDKSRGSADWTNATFEEASAERRERSNSNGRPVSLPPHQILPNPAYLRNQSESETKLNETDSPNVDYAVREVDYYYGVRGPALSSQPTRKLKTGPADPVGPVSSATGWFKNMLGRKTKDSGKGFEVVRSSRAPPPEFADETSPQVVEEPYRDSPPLQQDAYLPGQRTRSNTGDTEPPDEDDHDDEAGSIGSEEDLDEDFDSPRFERVSDVPPSLAPIDALGGIDIPSRFNSKYSRRSGKSSRRSSKKQASAGASQSIPLVPRRKPESTEHNAASSVDLGQSRLSTVMDAPERRDSQPISSSRVPFSGPEETPRPSIGANSMISIDDEQPPAQAGSSGRSLAAPPSNVQRLPRTSQDRPTSYGYVSQHRTSDRIQQPAFGENVNAGSSAEVVDSARTSRRSRETE